MIYADNVIFTVQIGPFKVWVTCSRPSRAGRESNKIGPFKICLTAKGADLVASGLYWGYMRSKCAHSREQ